LTFLQARGLDGTDESSAQGCSQVEMLEQARKLTEKFRCPMTKKRGGIYEKVLL